MADRKHRVFFALWPDEDTAGHLHALGADLVNHARGGGRPVAARNLHLTLAFAGAVDLATLDALIAGADAVQGALSDVRLDRLGFWPRGGVVYAAPTGPAPSHQRRLSSDIHAVMRDAGLAIETRPWQPHVTLARGVRGISLPRLGAPLSWCADHFMLAESHLCPGGARYEILRSWPLSPAPEEGE
jgi:2'-5' RNA ligase